MRSAQCQRLGRRSRSRRPPLTSRAANPKVCFQVGAARSLSECAMTIVASRSSGIRLPSAPGACSPANSHARTRALRIARKPSGRPLPGS